MNRLKKAYCRTYQTVFKLALPFLPYRTPEVVGSVKKLPEIILREKCANVLIITDKQIMNLGLTRRLEKALTDSGIPYTLYDGTVANPTTANVADALALYQENGCDAIIGFGGGSSMDCAKAVGARAVKPKQSLAQMKGILKVHKKLPLLMAVPTTAGTGSETTLAAVITDVETRHKYAINDFPLIPRYAVLDPKVTLSLPPFVTATTGMDALTHAVEAYVSTDANPLTDAAAIKAIDKIVHYLPQAVANGDYMKARSEMAYAQYLAGVAFNNASLGYVHAMAHQLGGYYNLPHGVCNAILLPYVQEFNLIGNLERFAVIAKAMDLNVDGMSPFEAGEACVYGLKTFGRYLGIPQNLRSLGGDPADFEVMAENAMKDACAATNPRKATKDQIIAIFQKAYDGD